MGKKFKYHAFISYSHKDKKWGDWLHRALENYRVPSSIKGSKNKNDDEIPSKLIPIFRDREELPTRSDLGEVILNALKNSHYLIVICSPNSADSIWVNKEIIEFKRMHGGDRVLAIVVGGEPNATDKLPMFNPEDEAFPKALRYKVKAETETFDLSDKTIEQMPDDYLSDQRIEPLAADAREVGDGKERAKIKLIAGLLGVGFDELWQREKRKKRQQFSLLTATILTIITIISGLALYSHQQKNIAIENYFEAERAREAEREQKEKATKNEKIALKQLATNRLRNGDRFGALQALRKIDFDVSVQKALAAGIYGFEDLMESTGSGTIFFLNDSLYLKNENNDLVQIKNFPATKYFNIDTDRILLFSDAGHLRLIDNNGNTVSDYIPEISNEVPCYVQKTKNYDFRVLLTYFSGTSVCSLHYSLVPVTKNGFGDVLSTSVCYADSEFSLDDEAGNPILISELEDMVGLDHQDDVMILSKMKDITPYLSLKSIPKIELPMSKQEKALWHLPSLEAQTPRKLYMATKDTIKHKFESDEQAPFLFSDYFEFYDESKDAFHHFKRVYPKVAYSDELFAMIGLDIEGMGGYSIAVCVGTHNTKLKCSSFGNDYNGAGYNGFRLAQTSKNIAIYGENLSGENEEKQSSLWVTDVGLSFYPLPEVNEYGEIQDVAFAPDGRLAILTKISSILIYEPETSQLRHMNKPNGATALTWLDNGKIVVLSMEGKLFFARPEEPFKSLTISHETLEKFSEKTNWITTSLDGKGIFIGANYEFIIYNAELLAPMTDIVRFEPDEVPFQAVIIPRLIGARSRINPDGSIVLDIDGHSYVRNGIIDDIEYILDNAIVK